MPSGGHAPVLPHDDGDRNGARRRADASTERHPHPHGRHGVAGRGLCRKYVRRDAAHRPAGRVGPRLRAVLRERPQLCADPGLSDVGAVHAAAWHLHGGRPATAARLRLAQARCGAQRVGTGHGDRDAAGVATDGRLRHGILRHVEPRTWPLRPGDSRRPGIRHGGVSRDDRFRQGRVFRRPRQLSLGPADG